MSTPMKSRRAFLSLFYFGCFLSLLLVFGCGDTEDMEETTSSIPDKLEKPWLWEKLKDEDWEKLKDGDWVRLTDAEVEELMNLEIPKRWTFETEDEALREKYHEATFFQKFGDIPQIRYIVEFDRQWRGGILTLELAEQIAAYQEAMYFLFPTAVNKSSLEEAIKPVEEKRERRFMEQLRREDAETWVKYKHAALIGKHGDLPEVHTVVNFMRKLELELPRTAGDCHAYFEAYHTLYSTSANSSRYESYAWLEAVHQIGGLAEDSLRQLKKYREARAEGISFYDIEWDDD